MSYPFTFEPASEEEKAERAKLYTGPQSVLVDIVRSKPLNILLPSRFTKVTFSSPTTWPSFKYV